MAVLVKVDEATFSMSARLPDQFETLMICDAAVVEVLVLLMVADVPPSVPFAIFAVKILTELGDLTLVQPSGPVMVPESRTARCSNSRSPRSEEHTSELQSLMRISYAVFFLKKKKTHNTTTSLCLRPSYSL